MIVIRDGCIIIFGFLGLVVIRIWEMLMGRSIGYCDWPSRQTGEYNEAVEAIYCNVRWGRVRELYARAKTEHRPAA